MDNVREISKSLLVVADVHEILDRISTILIHIGEQLVFYDDLGAEIIGNLEELVGIIEKIKLAHKQGRSLRMPVDVLLAKLMKLRNNMDEQLPNDRMTIFFLPYKASMWDSLESVWKEADKDENCDAVVMPIPYFDRNPDGSVREWHWEGNEFPEYVPITDYRNVDLDDVRPDTIYIHNPYDDCNFVTSVAPQYYSDKLKSYTSKLVYIPYFVSNEASATIELAERHARMPVYVYADVVVQQSEKMRNKYIEALVKIYGEKSRPVWENKIKGWGSPKFDKVIKAEKREQDIPQEWLDKIKKDDGSWKKVIMYGTGLAEMLNSGEQLLDKIENTLAFFKQKTDTVMIIWRPHPLLQATLESMRPGLSVRYSKIVGQYCNEGWGIYDDSTDLNRAIATCDAYYGDGSSVTQLFTAANKPVMIEDVAIRV